MARRVRVAQRGRVRWSSIGLAVSGALLCVVWAHGGTPATGPATATTAPATQPAAEGYFPKLTPAVKRPPLPAEVTKAFVIPIRDPITPTMAEAIERKIERITGLGGQLIIFDFETPGGRVDAADTIVKLIRRELRDIRTVAFINSDAISAGAWIALNCHEIVMVPGGKIGDCAPITMQGDLPGTVREKIESYLRTDFRNAAEANGYSPAIVQAMVSLDLEVWQIRNAATGEQRYVLRNEWIDRVSGAPGATTRPAIADAKWEFVKMIVAEGKLLTATTSEAVEYGLVASTVADMDELRTLYNITTAPKVLSDTWSEQVVDVLTSPAVTGVLVMLAMFFGYIELNTPGFGLGGTLALICLAVLFGSRFLTGLAQWWEIAVFVIGVVLIMIEIFVTPGVGVLGLSGGLLCVVGLLAMLVANPPGTLPIPAPGLIMDRFLDGVFALAVGFLGGCVLCIIVGRFLPKIPIAGRLILADVPTGDSLPADAESPIRRIEAGQHGVTETFCRPVGKARFGEDLIDVVTEGQFVPAGTAIVVQRNEGNRLVVEPLDPTA